MTNRTTTFLNVLSSCVYRADASRGKSGERTGVRDVRACPRLLRAPRFPGVRWSLIAPPNTSVVASLVAMVLTFVVGLPAQAQIPKPSAPQLSARAYVLVDFNSGRILASKDAHARLEPASLTKMMTTYAVFAELVAGRLTLDEKVKVSEKAWRMPGSRMFIEVDTEVSVEALIKGVVVQSGNDASVALAEHVSGEESAFAVLMNEHAKRLGMSGTRFTNASGLPDEDHYTTPWDMALMARALVRDFPQYYPWHALRDFTYNKIKQPNRNRLLWLDESVDGVKTGLTKSAGYCLVASAERDGMRLVSVIMGSKSAKARTKQGLALLRHGFRAYETRKLYPSMQPVTDARVWQGKKQTLPLGITEDLFVTIPKGQYDNLKALTDLDGRIVAPVSGGSPQGRVSVVLGDAVVAERPLVALETINRGGLWRRVSDYVRAWFQR